MPSGAGLGGGVEFARVGANADAAVAFWFGRDTYHITAAVTTAATTATPPQDRTALFRRGGGVIRDLDFAVVILGAFVHESVG